MVTPDALRADIALAEQEVAALRRDTPRDAVVGLLHRLDRVASGLEELRSGGTDLRAELSRMEGVHGTLKAKGRVVLRILSSQGGLAELRGRMAQPLHWWWRLGRLRAEQRSRRLAGTARGLLVAAALLAVGAVVYVRLGKPDQAARLKSRHLLQGESWAQEGRYDLALAEYQKALELAPDDPEVNLMVGLMLEARGEEPAAADRYARAAMLYAGQGAFLASRGQAYATLGWQQKAARDAQGAIGVDPDNALAHCVLGEALGSQGRSEDAVRMLRRCAELAREQGQDALYVVATVRLGALLTGAP